MSLVNTIVGKDTSRNRKARTSLRELERMEWVAGMRIAVVNVVALACVVVIIVVVVETTYKGLNRSARPGGAHERAQTKRLSGRGREKERDTEKRRREGEGRQRS